MKATNYFVLSGALAAFALACLLWNAFAEPTSSLRCLLANQPCNGIGPSHYGFKLALMGALASTLIGLVVRRRRDLH